MDPHSIVIISLHTPKEKLWGELLSINPSGVTMRGIDLYLDCHTPRKFPASG